MVARLAQDLIAHHNDGVRRENVMVLNFAGYCTRFFACQSLRILLRKLAGAIIFIDVCHMYCELNAGSGEQFASAGR